MRFNTKSCADDLDGFGVPSFQEAATHRHPDVDKIWTCQEILAIVRICLKVPYSIYFRMNYVYGTGYNGLLGSKVRRMDP